MRQDEPFRRALEGLVGIPATEGNEVEILRDGVEIFPAMLAAIEGARSTVDLLTFVYWRGEIAARFAQALCERARAGVRCRVILDAVGARHVDEQLVAEMEASGVHLHWFRELADGLSPGHRTHRKVLICDEEVAFAGGVGIAGEWDGSSDDGTGWRETQLQLRGPAVDGLRAAFADDWVESGRDLFDEHDRFPLQPQAGSTTAMVVRGEAENDGWNDVALLRQVLFRLAEERIRVTTAYFSPDPATVAALVGAARRGVQVQLLVPGERNDKAIARLAGERLYETLLDEGIELHAFRPTMLHAKVTTVDGKVAVVGSANLNSRSLRLDEEVDVVLLDADVTARLDAHTDQDLERCERVLTRHVNGYGPLRRFAQGAVGLLRRQI